MKIELLAFDEMHYASNIVQNDTVLKWDALGNTHHLIIRSDFGNNIEFTNLDKDGLEKYSNDQILSGKEIRYSDNHFFSFIRKGYVNNYTYTVSPARYAVFCCEYNTTDDICKIYLPNEACLYQCDIYACINVRIEKEQFKKSLFKRKPEKEYYILNIPSIPGYIDGSLHYSFDGCKYQYPITKAMLGKPIYIPAFASRAPKIESSYGSGNGNGYKIQIS